MKNPTMNEAEQAATLLQIDVYHLADILRDAAADEFARASERVRRGESPGLSQAHRLVRAADALHGAWQEVEKAKIEVEPDELVEP